LPAECFSNAKPSVTRALAQLLNFLTALPAARDSTSPLNTFSPWLGHGRFTTQVSIRHERSSTDLVQSRAIVATALAGSAVSLYPRRTAWAESPADDVSPAPAATYALTDSYRSQNENPSTLTLFPIPRRNNQHSLSPRTAPHTIPSHPDQHPPTG
jgi:hypothetical protein